MLEAIESRSRIEIFLKKLFYKVTCWMYGQNSYRSSRPQVFCKKGVLKNFAKFKGKHVCQSLFFNKVAGLRPKACNFITKRLWRRCLPRNFVKFLWTPFLIKHLRWLLLLLKMLVNKFISWEFQYQFRGQLFFRTNLTDYFRMFIHRSMYVAWNNYT